MKWLIDDMMADPYYGGQFYQALLDLERQVKVIDYLPFEYKKYESLVIDQEHLIYGSVQFVEKMLKTQSNVMSFGPSSSYNFSHYSAFLDPELLLSKDYCFITMSFLKNEFQLESLKKRYGQYVFIRPDTGNKLFSGQVVDLEDSGSIRNLFRSGGAVDNTLAIVSSAVNIKQEWRFIVSRNNGLISGSTYSADPNSYKKEVSDYPEKAGCFAEKVMENFGDNAIDKILVIDVAYTGQDYKLVEINAASTSGMYGCHCKPIILEMEAIIKEENGLDF